MAFLVKTTRFTRSRLPHWEVEGGRYFVTVRCHDSLPHDVVARLQEVNLSLQRIGAASPEFTRMQRQYFLTMEKYLDQGAGACLLRRTDAANALVSCLASLEADGALVPHFTIMPNHWHALIAPVVGKTLDLYKVMAQLKGRSSRAINEVLGRRGPLWQREWFDRWMRSEEEWVKCRDYIRQNPVKAGLVKDWQGHLWTQ